MRTYGRVLVDQLQPDGPKVWVEISTDAAGYSDGVYLTAIAQTLKLNLNESPFWANFGIPAKQSVMQQLMPDYYINFTQQYYSQFFAALTVAKRQLPEPVYDISVVTHQGAQLRHYAPNPYPS